MVDEDKEKDQSKSAFSVEPRPKSVYNKNKLDELKILLLKLNHLFRNNTFRDSVYTIYNHLSNKVVLLADESIEPAVPESYDPLVWSKKKLVFKKFEEPMVSVIIPVYNKWGYTYNCLKSILQTSGDCSIEIIIADDCSSDETAELERYVDNVIHVRNEKNLNFLRNCNNASHYAHGKYLLFLNNDTLVRPNWLQSLIELIESDDTIGMVGSKFIFPDGTLQEAGGIVWSDATGANYGRGRNPLIAEFNYVKDVDYISGASIMIYRSLWENIGGFDERFSPAYFEDSDLAFAVRSKGYRVVFQPRSEVIHFERTSQGENAIKLCETNRVKFVDKWSSVLDTESCIPWESTFLQRDRSRFKKHILVIDDMVPMFDQHAGGKTTYQFLRLLVDLGFKVTFFGDNGAEIQPYTGLLQQMGIEVIYGHTYTKDIFAWLDKNKQYLDTVFLNRPEIASKYIDWFKKNTQSKIVYYGHDLHYLREYREYELTGDKKLLQQSEDSKKCEYDIMSKSDIILSVSPEEKEIIDKEMNMDTTKTVPIFFYENFKKHIDLEKKKGLLFIGGYNHTPNVDAVKWFVEEVFPIIKKYDPNIMLTLAGSHPNKYILGLESESIHVTGYLTDDELDGLYDHSLISIIPLRFGAGVKGKTVDSMYHGMAIVSTSIGLEGLPNVDRYLDHFDDRDSFAQEVIRLLSDPKSIEKQSVENMKYVEETFSYDSALKTFRDIFGSGEK